jgi:hypothetical protein
MKKVQALIRQASDKPGPFTDAMLADIREVLAANDAEPNRLRRVTAEKMRSHLRDAHGYTGQRCTFAEHLRLALNRGWSK